MTTALLVGGTEIRPGSRQTVELELPRLYTHTPVVMSAHVIRGKREGPCLFVSAAVHGDEINGVEIIRRLIRSTRLRHLRGTLIAVPVVNVYGFVRGSRYLPDRRDLNRNFPGSERGSLTSRLANTFLQEIVAKSDVGVDLHTGAVHRENLPQIRASLDQGEQVERIAKAFASPVILNADLRDGSLREAARALDVPVIVYEGGEALRFDEMVIRAGVRGVIGVMGELGMLASRRRRGGRPAPEPVVARSSQWVRAPQSGILRAVKRLGARVARHETLGWVSDPLGNDELAVESPAPGVVIGKVNLPLVNEGEALYHIARFDETATAAETVERFQESLDPEDDLLETDDPPIG